MTPTKANNRPRFQFRFRTLLLVVTALAVICGVISGVTRWQSVQSREREARASLHPYGGTYSMASALYLERTTRKRGWFYVTFLNHVREVDLSPHAWPAVERRAAGKPPLQMTDNALVVLRGFVDLRGLNLRDSQVTDAGIGELKRLTRLETLDISGTRISEAGAHELQAALPSCRVLHLDRTTQSKSADRP